MNQNACLACRAHRCHVLATLVALLSLLVSTITATAADLARVQPLAPPPVSAKAAYVVDTTSGTELFALDPDEPLPPASLTKLVVALVVVDKVGLDEVVKIDAADLVDPEQSQVGLIAGDSLTVRDLLFGLLIPSGNDASLALARYVGTTALGDPKTDAKRAVSSFVQLMNDKAAALGAIHSHFANPAGLDQQGQVMTARDVAVVATAAMKNPLIAEIVATPSAVLASRLRSDGYPVTTTNLLLQEGVVDGIKTGTTPEAGGCLVTSYRVGPNEIIAVVLGSRLVDNPDGSQDSSARFDDTRAIMTAVSADYAWLDPAAPGVVAGLVDELHVWDVSLAGGALLPVPAERAGELRYRLVLGPPAGADRPTGEVQFLVGDHLLSERPAMQTS
jgi:D-alanyl-D-alanine carboxypeptidase